MNGSGVIESDGPIVTCEGVTKRYDRGKSGGPFQSGATGPAVTALEDLDLTVHPGEVVGISGPSGSGKTTLLHLVAALDVPTEGTVLLDGNNPASMSSRKRAALRLSTVGIVFQRFHLLSSVTARSNVALPLIEKGVARRERRERATELLESVGLGDRLDHVPAELSGGEQQRVAIARALAVDPPLIVADEPTGELDSTTGARILDLLEDLSAEGRAIIIASHDRTALERTDRIVMLRDGRRVEASNA